MRDTDVIYAAVKMRQAQKQYFKSRSRDDLIKSKELETAFDKMVKDWEAEDYPGDGQPDEAKEWEDYDPDC